MNNINSTFYTATGIRLQKYLAQAGIASRREAEKIIAAGRVSVNGVKVTTQGYRINAKTSLVRVDGVPIYLVTDKIYIAYNKPRGIYTTLFDEKERPCVGNVLINKNIDRKGITYAGRLDADSEGLLLLTNDGELAYRITHPSFKVMKNYLITVMGRITKTIVSQLLSGVLLPDGSITRFSTCSLEDYHEGVSLVKVGIYEGRNRIIRKTMQSIGFPVSQLLRTGIGNIKLHEQKPGSLRYLSVGEIRDLYQIVEM